MPIARLNIFAGQSNAEGLLQGVLPSQPGLTTNIFGRARDWYGAEYGFVEALRANGVTDHIHLTKLTDGATRIDQVAGLDWSPDSRGELFDQLVNMVKADIASLTQQGYTVVVDSFNWFHGEAHARTDQTGLEYQALLEDFITEFRAAIGLPNLPTFLTEIVEVVGNPNRQGAEEINQSLHGAAENLSDTSVIETDGLEVRDGASHFDPSGYFRIGERWAAGILTGGYTSPAVYGSVRADTLVGTAAKDIIFGKSGDDRIDGLGGNDILQGGNGIDRILGGDGDDYLNGDDGDDAMYGGTGSDTIWGGDDKDSIDGGAGADRIDGVGGIDSIVFTRSPRAVNVNLTTGLGRGGDAEGDTYTRIERIYGSEYGDVLAGDAADNVIRGAGGSDRLYGRDGNDDIRGGAGGDIVFGGRGNDLMSGESSSSTNTFSFQKQDFAAGEQDTIIGLFSNDRLEFTDYNAADVTVTVQGSDSLITLENGAVDGTILVKGWTDANALEALFVF